MLEYVIIVIVVLGAVFFTGRYLWREVKEGQCAHCNCALKKDVRKKIIQIDISEKITKQR